MPKAVEKIKAYKAKIADYDNLKHSKLNELSFLVSTLDSQYNNARGEVSIIKNGLIGLSDTDKERQKNRLKFAESKLETIAGEYEKADKNFKDLEYCVNVLEDEIISENVAITDEDLVELSTAISGLKSQMENYLAVSSENKAAIEKLEKGLIYPKDFTEERESLLSDIAMGKPLNKELEKLDKQIKTDKEKADNNNAAINEKISVLQSTDTGLTKKIIELHGKLTGIDYFKKDALIFNFIHKANEASLKYGQLTESLMEEYKRLLTLNDLIKSYGGDSKHCIVYGTHHELLIPSFNTLPLKEIGNNGGGNVLAHESHFRWEELAEIKGGIIAEINEKCGNDFA